MKGVVGFARTLDDGAEFTIEMYAKQMIVVCKYTFVAWYEAYSLILR
jgi:hypothetical protein